MDTDRRKDEHWEHRFDFFSEEQTIHGTNDTPPTDDTSTPTTTTTTTTTTATLQKYNLTLTKKFDHEPATTADTTTTFADESLGDHDDQDDGLFETRATLLMEQMASLHGQLGHMLPTRSYYNNGTSSSSLGGGGIATTTTATSSLAPSTLSDQSPPSMISCPYVSSSPLSLSPNNQGELWASSSFDGYSQNSNDGLLHPLQAAHEDVALYESNLMTMRRQMGLIKDGMEWIHQHPCPTAEQALATVEDPQDVSQQRQLARLSQMDQAYHSLQFRMGQAEQQFLAFRQGFNFSQACYAVRVALDTVQANMMQQRTMMTANHHQEVVQAWEENIARTTQQLADLRLEYPDYFKSTPEEEGDEQQQSVVRAYEDRWVAMQQKNELVRTWVEEVRVWFAEAERIRQWIDERRDQLMETTLPDPLGPLEEGIQVASGLEQVKEWQAQHQLLETDMEHFDQQDMARLRSHVKTLTMGGKDLSPADTTTIEITLTTLTTLDKVMHALRTKRDRLHLLTQRALWEAEYAKTMQWLHETENQVDSFLSQQARWTDDDDTTSISKADLIDGLLALEHKLSEFDKTGFTTTVNLYQDFDDAAQEDLPSHLEQRQTNCEQFFEDLFKRMAFVRNVVEQRLAMMDFMALVDQVSVDGHALQLDLQQEAITVVDDEQVDEEGWAERVQAMQERIIPLASSQRIPYPVVTLMVDEQENEAANQMIRHYVGHHRTQLVLLGEAVDGQWQALRQRWQLQQRMKTMVAEADQWKGWANDRSTVIQQNHQHLLNDDPDLDQLVEWERTLSTIQSKVVAKKIQVKSLEDKATGLKLAMNEAGLNGATGLDIALSEMTRAYVALDDDMIEHETALMEGRKRLEHGHSAVDRQKELARFIQALRTSLPGLKQTCGFMTGQSQAQDKDRLDTLTGAVVRMTADIAEKQALVDQQTKEAWTGLMDEIAQLQVFQETVQDWYHRQRRLSLVEQSLENSDALEDQLTTLAQLGKEIGMAADPTDPLQTANYSCAKDRHQVLVHRAQIKVDEARQAQERRDQDTEWQNYQDQVARWVAAIDADREGLETRLAEQEQQAWDLVANVAALAGLARTAASHHKTTYDHHRSNWPQAPRHSSCGTNDDRIRAALDRLDQTLAKEKRQAVMIRQLHVHAKAAQDLQDWLDQCGAALGQLTMDIGVQDELDVRASLGRFEAKLESMRPALDGFERLEHKIVEPLDSQEHKEKVQAIGKHLQAGFDQVGNQLKEIAMATDRHRHHVGIARKLKDLLHMIGGYRDTLAAIRIPAQVTHGAIHDYGTAGGDDAEETDCLSPWLMTCPLSMIPTDQGVAAARDELDRLEHDIQVHLDNGALQDLDESLLGLESTEMFMDQRKEITQAIAGLTKGIQEKRLWLAEASKLEFILIVLEEWEVLLSALAEVVDRSSPSCSTTTTTSTTPNTTRADLQARLIDLDTRYRYYEPNIQALVKEAQLVMMMHNEDAKQDARIVTYYNQLTEQWRQLQQLAMAKKQALMARIGPLAEPLMMSALHDALPGGHQRRFQQQQQDQRRPMTTMSTRTTTTAPLDRGCARKASYQQLTDRRRRAVTPTATVIAPPRLMTAERAKKRSSWRESTKEDRAVSPMDTTYVADPKNDLDVALGNIVNDSPYAIKVKMVPGEVGRYWFGKKNPKLAYCRILRSRMVMVRVGGGWVELSQFLRDHALLEEGRFSSSRNAETPPPQIKKRHSNPLPPATPGLRHSKSTPFQPSSYYCHPSPHGVKNGNKFFVTDDDGNQVQVTMTKAPSKQTSAYRTPWR